MKKHTKKHSTFGGVGAEKCFCLDCNRIVPNKDYEEESAMLKRLAKKKTKNK